MPLVTPDTDSSPICPDSFEPANFNGDVCTLLQQLLLTNEKLYGLLKWMFDQEGSGCHLSAAFAADLLGLSHPIGSGFWSPYDMGFPNEEEWIKADGRSLPKEGLYAPLYKAFGANRFKADTATEFFLPNLKGRMMIVEGRRDKYDPTDVEEPDPPTYTADSTSSLGGYDKVRLSEPEIANHRHGVLAYHVNQTEEWKDDHGSGADRAAMTFTSPITVKAFEGSWNDVGENLGTQNIDGYSKVSTTTTENIITTPFNEDTDKGDAHENMPPYFVGIYYIRANFKIGGTIIPMVTP